MCSEFNKTTFMDVSKIKLVFEFKISAIAHIHKTIIKITDKAQATQPVHNHISLNTINRDHPNSYHQIQGRPDCTSYSTSRVLLVPHGTANTAWITLLLPITHSMASAMRPTVKNTQHARCASRNVPPLHWGEILLHLSSLQPTKSPSLGVTQTETLARARLTH
jgi:hypothetical protein